MVEQIIAFMNAIGVLTQRNARIYIAFGLLCFLANHFKIFPVAIDPIILGFAAVLVLLGSAVFCADFFAILSALFWDIFEKRGREEIQKQKSAEESKEAIKNLQTLTATECQALYLLFKKGNQRDSKYNPGTHELISKRILRKVDRSSGVYEVDEGIWNIRDEIMQDLSNFKPPKK